MFDEVCTMPNGEKSRGGCKVLGVQFACVPVWLPVCLCLFAGFLMPDIDSSKRPGRLPPLGGILISPVDAIPSGITQLDLMVVPHGHRDCAAHAADPPSPLTHAPTTKMQEVSDASDGSELLAESGERLRRRRLTTSTHPVAGPGGSGDPRQLWASIYHIPCSGLRRWQFDLPHQE